MKVNPVTGDAYIAPEEIAGLKAGTRIAEVREQLPEIIGAAVRIVADNPSDVAFTLGSMIVLDKILINLVKPRTMVEMLAVMAVAPVLSTYMLKKAVDAGMVDFRLREPDGTIVRLSEKRREKASGAPGEV